MADEPEDGSSDDGVSVEFGSEVYSDFVAERAAAFGQLALKLGQVQNDAVAELGLAMLRTIIRSIKTPPDASLHEVI